MLAERRRLHDLAVDASTRLMMQSLESGMGNRVMVAARRLLSLDPLYESACRTGMQILAGRGESAQALKLFETLKSRLRQELSVAPEAATS